MQNYFTSTAIIRQRGQLTIPDDIRDKVSWLDDNSVVTVTAKRDEEISIRPYGSAVVKKVDWKKVWEGIKLARSFKGKRGNLSKFIAEDRKRHF